MLGVTIRQDIGIGDKVQFSSLPQNYFFSTGQKLVDVSKAWIYDFNPYVVRDVPPRTSKELWNFPQTEPWTNPRVYKNDPAVYLSNAEVTASRFKVEPTLIRPRLYRNEDFPFASRRKILLHVEGRSHGRLPDKIIDHVVRKYGPSGELFQVGLPSEADVGIPRITTSTVWELAQVISEARMFIGPDSGPSWIAACYPDVVAKKVRLRKVHGQKLPKDWIPLEIGNLHSHWDDRCFQVHCDSEQDQGFMQSFRRI